MSFFETPAFFVLLAIAAIPAVVLGLTERPLKRYGLVVSVIFLVLLFSTDLYSLGCFAFFLVWASALTFAVQRMFAKEDAHAVAKYRIALVLIIAPLVIYKIAAVFDSNLLGFLGISYITFKAVQVLIEVRDGLIKDMRFVDYLYFLVFFTPFTSGPIMRSREFIEDCYAHLTRGDYTRLLYRGVGFLLLGVVYKFVLAALFSWAMWFLPSYIGDAGAGHVAFGQYVQAWGYMMYLFFDFAGYSLMAVGAGCIFGVRVPMNFNAPFRSLDIKDFWNRWHMSLSYWLRDFVFMRISRACLKHKVFKSRLTVACLGYMANMTLMGVWHGLTVECIVYGLYHGLLLALTEVIQRKSKWYKKHKSEKWFTFLSWLVTVHLVVFGCAIFSGQVTTLLMGA